MNQLTDKQKAKLKKVADVAKSGNMAILQYLMEMEDMAKGETGQQGIQGVKGEKGDKGDKGDTGIQGIAGKDGKDGIGKEGKNGRDGRDGRDGIDGLNGNDGKDGKDGVINEDELSKRLTPFRKEFHTALGQAIQGMPRGSNWGGFIETPIKAGSNITIVTDGSGARVISSSGGSSSSGFQQPLTGGLTGTNTWATAPNVIVVDTVSKQKVQTDSTVNWTGTTTTVLSVKPTFDIFSSA
jgi:hypothetical protein